MMRLLYVCISVIAMLSAQQRPANGTRLDHCVTIRTLSARKVCSLFYSNSIKKPVALLKGSFPELQLEKNGR